MSDYERLEKEHLGDHEKKTGIYVERSKQVDTIRVLRVIEYIGPRKAVEEQVRKSIHGERRIDYGSKGEVLIRAATVNEFPDILDNIQPCHLMPGQAEPEKDLLWTEDECTRNTEGHVTWEQAWLKLKLIGKPLLRSAKEVDHEDCIEYQFPNGVSLWNIHGAYHELRYTK